MLQRPAGRPALPAWLLLTLALVGAGPAAAQDAPLGVFLVARQGMRDPRFAETVVLVTRHRHGAPVGVIINRPLDVPVSHALPDSQALAGRSDPLFFGGPVSPGTLVLVHRAPARPREALRVLDDVYMSVNPEVLAQILGGPALPPEFRVYTGYAGWAPGQLEAEIDRGDWHVLPARAEAVFRADPKTVWRDLVDQARRLRRSI
jgi:putative transcriptional regulator